MNFLDYPTQKPKRTFGPIGIVAVVLLLILGVTSIQLPDHAGAIGGTRTWDGGGIDNNWSTCANWTGDVCPVSSDNVVFDATSTKNATVDASYTGTINAYNINAGYTGTVTMARSLTVNAGYTQVTGTFTAANQLLTAASFTLSGGTFTASSGNTTVTGALTISGSPTFNANGGTFNFSGSTATLSCNGVAFNLVSFSANTNTKTINSNCSLPLGSNPTIANNITVNGTISGSGTMTYTSGTLTLGTTGSFSGFSGLVSSASVTINGTLNAGAFTTFDMNGAFTVGATGNFTAPSGTATFASTFTLNSSSTFTANGGTVTFDSGGAATLTCGGKTFNLVTFANTSSKIVGSTCTLPLGSNPTITAGVTNSGTLTGSGTLNATSGILRFNSTGSISGFSGLTTAGGLSIAGATIDFSGYTTLTVEGDFTIGTAGTGGTFGAPTGNMSVGSNLNLFGGTFNANGGTLTFITSNVVTVSQLQCNNTAFAHVVFAHTSGAKDAAAGDCDFPLGTNPTIYASLWGAGTLRGTGTLSFVGTNSDFISYFELSGFSGLAVGGDLMLSTPYDFGSYTTLSIGGDLTVYDGGEMTAPSGTMTVGGDFNTVFSVYPPGIFHHNNGTVILDGGNQAITGNNTFYNLTKEVSSASTLTLPAGSTQTVVNKLTLKGKPLQLLSLVSSTPGSSWLVNLRGTAAVCSVDVTDSNSVGSNITAYSSFTNSANPGWIFNDAVCGGGGGSGGVIEPTTAVTNFQFTQAAAIAGASSDKQISLVLGATNQRLPSPISSAFGKILGGPGFVRSVIAFLAVCLVIVIAGGIGFWRLIIWKNRHNKENWQIQARTGQDTW